jgi:hypothetical protein
MMMSLKSLHHGDSHPSGTMSSRLSALRMTSSLYHSEEPFGFAQDLRLRDEESL